MKTKITQEESKAIKKARRKVKGINARKEHNKIEHWDFNATPDEKGNIKVTLPTFDLGDMKISEFKKFLVDNQHMEKVVAHEPLVYRSADRGDVCNSRELAFKLVKMGYHIKDQEVLWLQ